MSTRQQSTLQQFDVKIGVISQVNNIEHLDVAIIVLVVRALVPAPRVLR